MDCFVNNREPAVSMTSQSRKRIGLFTNPFLHIKRATLHDRSDFSKNSHSTETNFNYSMNFKSDKNVRSSNVVKFEFELRHIPNWATVWWKNYYNMLAVFIWSRNVTDTDRRTDRQIAISISCVSVLRHDKKEWSASVKKMHVSVKMVTTDEEWVLQGDEQRSPFVAT